MVGAVSGTYNSGYIPGSISRTNPIWSTRRGSNPETAVEPVTPVRPTPDVSSDQGRVFRQELPALREGVDPVEWAVRMRIQPAQQGEQADTGAALGTQKAALPGQPSGETVPLPGQSGGEIVTQSGKPDGETMPLPGQSNKAENLPGMPGQSDKAEDLPGLPGEDAAAQSDGALGAEGVQEAAEEGKCETCEKRKYQDGSDDPGVSFKTPTNVSPEMAVSAVRGHEQEHVVREQAKAQREDRKVVSQTVTYHTAICPECGRAYVSGGTTRTVTAANPQEEQPDLTEEEGTSPFTPAEEGASPFASTKKGTSPLESAKKDTSPFASAEKNASPFATAKKDTAPFAPVKNGASPFAPASVA